LAKLCSTSAADEKLSPTIATAPTRSPAIPDLTIITQARRNGRIGVKVRSLFSKGATLHQAGRLVEAEKIFRQILKMQPNHFGSLHLLGVIFYQRGNYTEAVRQLDFALLRNPNHVSALNNRGLALHKLKRFEEALASYDRALMERPHDANALYNRGNTFCELRRFEEALKCYDRALIAAPDFAEAHLNRGGTLHELKQFEEALASYDRALGARPDLVEALSGRGNTLKELKRFEEALASYDRAISARSDFAEAHFNRGLCLHELKRFEEALASYDRAISARPDFAEAHFNRGLTLHDLRQFEVALASYDRALTVRPDLPEAHFNRGLTLHELKRFEEALASYERALSLRPGFVEALSNRATTLHELERFEEALASYDSALRLQPFHANALYNRGNTLRKLERFEEALTSYDRALTAKPDFAEAHCNRGHTLFEMNRLEEAYAAYDTALKIKPDIKQLAGARVHAKQCLCDWVNLENDISILLEAVRNGQPASPPFPLLAVMSSPEDQLQCARGYNADLPRFAPLWSGNNYKHERLHVAYLSSDFREHPIAFLTVGLFEEHDKSRFELSAISYGPQAPKTDMHRRVKAAFENLIDVGRQTDEKIAELIRELEIDVAVDLNGITQHARPGILARRPAPVQVAYLGYTSTTGADYIDYVIADSTVIPREHIKYFTEKVVWLPDSFMVNDARRPISAQTPTRGECGLPENAFVFCCFNNSFKITPELFEIWMRLLNSIENSVLWLRGHSPAIMANLCREAEIRGVSSCRLVFAPKVSSMADHLARHRQADLFLDTLPYNAHTTACDALWAGVPVLTCLGATFAGRVAASLNNAVGLDELVTYSLEEYESMALKLSQDPGFLNALRSKLANNCKTYPLFDTNRFARNMEAAYTMMWEQHQRGQPRS
jgi:protein O-GlcNAc transferase